MAMGGKACNAGGLWVNPGAWDFTPMSYVREIKAIAMTDCCRSCGEPLAVKVSRLDDGVFGHISHVLSCVCGGKAYVAALDSIPGPERVRLRQNSPREATQGKVRDRIEFGATAYEPDPPRESAVPVRCPHCDAEGICDVLYHGPDIELGVKCRACRKVWCAPAGSITHHPVKLPRVRIKPADRVVFNSKLVNCTAELATSLPDIDARPAARSGEPKSYTVALGSGSATIGPRADDLTDLKVKEYLAEKVAKVFGMDIEAESSPAESAPEPDAPKPIKFREFL